MKHWIRYLPNVGDPFLARAEEIENLNAKILKALKRRDECERDVARPAYGDWTVEEIRAARVEAVRDAVPRA